MTQLKIKRRIISLLAFSQSKPEQAFILGLVMLAAAWISRIALSVLAIVLLVSSMASMLSKGKKEKRNHG